MTVSVGIPWDYSTTLGWSRHPASLIEQILDALSFYHQTVVRLFESQWVSHSNKFPFTIYIDRYKYLTEIDIGRWVYVYSITSVPLGNPD